MTKIENWSRRPDQETATTPCIWQHDNDILTQKTGKTVAVSILSFDNGKIMVRAEPRRLFPRDVDSITTGGANPQTYPTVDAARTAVTDYLERHPLHVTKLDRDNLQDMLHDIQTGSDHLDIAYFLHDVAAHHATNDYTLDVLPGSNQVIITHTRTGSTVYDSADHLTDREAALDIAERITGDSYVIDHATPEPGYQYKTMDDLIAELRA